MHSALIAFLSFLFFSPYITTVACISRGCQSDGCNFTHSKTAPLFDGTLDTQRNPSAGRPREKMWGNCLAGFAWHGHIDTGAGKCVDCSLLGAVVGMVRYPNQSQRCVRCGGGLRAPGLLNASYVAEGKKCVCPAGYEVVEHADGQVLGAQMCARCPTNDSFECIFPYTHVAGRGCKSSKGYIKVYDSSCVTAEEYERMAAAASGATINSRLLNLNNHEASELPMTAMGAQNYSIGVAVQCARGQAAACNFLANICVWMAYDTQSLPCKLYLFLLSGNTLLYNLPRLYYQDESNLGDASIRLNGIGAGEVLTFIVSVYDWWGNWKGMRRMSEEFNLCHVSDAELEGFFKFASNRKLRCFVDWSGFAGKFETTDFFELFVEDPSNASRLIAVPVVLHYTDDDAHLEDVRDSHVHHHRAASYRRRFYVYDDVVYTAMHHERHTRDTTRHVTALRHATFVFNTSGSVGTPVVVLEYASRILPADGSRHAPSLGMAVEGGLSVRFITDEDAVDKGMMITMIVFTFLCFFFAWIRAYGWMRRRQNMMLNLGVVIRFIVYFCNHIGNMFALIVTLATWYIFAVYRSQVDTVGFVMSDRYVYMESMLYTAAAAKGIAVIYAILEQCNADYFIIDWEKCKGQLLRENRILPVSMWRSTFVANELNELQGLRQWRPLLTMAIVLIFLLDFDYLRYAKSVPTTPTAGDVGVYFITSLRIAIGTFLWSTVSLLFYIVEYQFLYRFIRVHPLRAFVDLCSVSNISIMILPETQWGYYIHGESIHAHADVSMEEFQQNLYLESQGNLPVRGLGGQSKCQTFEVFLGTYMRQYLYMCYREIEMRHRRPSQKTISHILPGRRWHFFGFVLGISRKIRVHDAETLAIKTQINTVLQQSVRSAESTLLIKFPLHRLFDVPPNILYMNGPQSGDKSGKDLFFVDDAMAYGKAFLYGIDLDLFVLYTMLYASVDAATHTVWAAMLVTFAVETVLCWYRRGQGVVNISTKTLIDDHFFL